MSDRSVRLQLGSFGPRILGLVLVVAPLHAGCGNSGEGTVQLSPETRSRLLPHTAPNAKDRKGKPIGNQPLSVKDKMRQNAASADSAN